MDHAKEMKEKGADLLIKDLRKEFALNSGVVKRAVNDLTLGVNKGTIFGLLGMNGAGKTTTIKLVQGMMVPTAGDAVLEGISCGSDPDAARKLMGICPQHDVLWDELTAREHLTLYAKVRGIPEDKVEQAVNDMIKATKLEKHADKETHTYNGGSKRKLSIAIAMLGNPSCVFLDEPTTGLDPNTRRWVFLLWRGWEAGGCASCNS